MKLYKYHPEWSLENVPLRKQYLRKLNKYINPFSFLSVNEIIGRDMSQISVSHGAGVAIHSSHASSASLETGLSDGAQ